MVGSTGRKCKLNFCDILEAELQIRHAPLREFGQWYVFPLPFAAIELRREGKAEAVIAGRDARVGVVDFNGPWPARNWRR
jgi:hypothetical protein